MAVTACVFVLLFCEFGLVRLTSSLSLSVFGVVKELLTILVAAAARGDIITPTNLAGFFICAGGMLAYHSSKAGAAVVAPQPGQSDTAPLARSDEGEAAADDADSAADLADAERASLRKSPPRGGGEAASGGGGGGGSEADDDDGPRAASSARAETQSLIQQSH